MVIGLAIATVNLWLLIGLATAHVDLPDQLRRPWIYYINVDRSHRVLELHKLQHVQSLPFLSLYILPQMHWRVPVENRAICDRERPSLEEYVLFQHQHCSEQSYSATEYKSGAWYAWVTNANQFCHHSDFVLQSEFTLHSSMTLLASTVMTGWNERP